MRILIVEPESVVANAIACALEARGHEVSLARSAQVALGMPRPEVLIADPEMSGLSGLDLLEEYKLSGHAPRTVFVSALPSLDSCRRALRLGAQEFLSKPFRLEELIRAVEQSSNSTRPLFEQKYAATTASIEACLRDIAAFALQRGVGPTCRARACTALGELIENVLDHAYPFCQGEFQVTATVDNRDLVLSLSDSGAGFDVDEVLSECLLKDGGFARASSLSEKLDIVGGLGLGTTVTLRFSAYLVDFAGEDSADLTELDFLEPETTRQVLSTVRMVDSDGFLQLPPSLAVVVGRLLAGPDAKRVIAQALRS